LKTLLAVAAAARVTVTTQVAQIATLSTNWSWFEAGVIQIIVHQIQVSSAAETQEVAAAVTVTATIFTH